MNFCRNFATSIFPNPILKRHFSENAKICRYNTDIRGNCTQSCAQFPEFSEIVVNTIFYFMFTLWKSNSEKNQARSDILKIIFWKCEIVWQNLVEILNAKRCSASLLRCGLMVSSPGRELRPEDACQKRFSWFSDVFRLESQGAKACKSCRSRQELSNEWLLSSCKNLLRHSRERAVQSLLIRPPLRRS